MKKRVAEKHLWSVHHKFRRREEMERVMAHICALKATPRDYSIKIRTHPRFRDVYPRELSSKHGRQSLACATGFHLIPVHHHYHHHQQQQQLIYILYIIHTSHVMALR